VDWIILVQGQDQWKWWWLLRFCKRWGISWSAEWLLASQEGSLSVEYINVSQSVLKKMCSQEMSVLHCVTMGEQEIGHPISFQVVTFSNTGPLYIYKILRVPGTVFVSQLKHNPSINSYLFSHFLIMNWCCIFYIKAVTINMIMEVLVAGIEFVKILYTVWFSQFAKHFSICRKAQDCKGRWWVSPSSVDVFSAQCKENPKLNYSRHSWPKFESIMEWLILNTFL
jgi:hypothetical protein